MMPSFGLAEELQTIEAALASKPEDIPLRVRRAATLDALGRTEAAKLAYIETLRSDPTNAEALNNLGTLLFNSGYRSAARLTYQELIKHHPQHVMGLVNLANAEFEAGHLDVAAALYEVAIAIEPDTALAHQGLSYVHARLGNHEAAEAHREIGFRLAPVLLSPYRGNGVPVGVLLLLAPQRANIATDLILDDTTFLVAKVFPEYYDEALPLPPHDVVFNAIGDAELSGKALQAAERMVKSSGAHVINAPESVRHSSRLEIAARLRGIEGIVAPRIELVARENVERLRMTMPFLLRTPGFHTGEHFERIDSSESLAAALRDLPGNELLAIEFLDARAADGAARKYRVLFIDGVPYPLHLARSTHWKVHYYTADLVLEPEAVAEEERFLTDMPGALGTRAMRALEAVRDELRLEYFGVDFALDRDGSVLLFEANATMKVVPPAARDASTVRHAAAKAALAASRALVLRRAKG